MASKTGITHWFYFPDEQVARNAAKALTGEGYSIRVDGPDPENYRTDWLVRAARATQHAAQDIFTQGEQMEKIAKAFGGAYDGNEIGPLTIKKGAA